MKIDARQIDATSCFDREASHLAGLIQAGAQGDASVAATAVERVDQAAVRSRFHAYGVRKLVDPEAGGPIELNPRVVGSIGLVRQLSRRLIEQREELRIRAAL